MTMPDSAIKEHLQRGYVKALAAMAGVELGTYDSDFGTDITLSRVRKVGKKYRSTGTKICLQLKSTVDYSFVDGHFVYDLEAEAYNKLVEWEGYSKCYLVVLALPRSKVDWLVIGDDHLMLRHICYWQYLDKGQPTPNTGSVRMKIPQTQVFSHKAILDFFRAEDQRVANDATSR